MSARIITGDALAALSGLPDQSVNCCVTSPPYWGLRDYGQEGQIGLEETPEAYVARLVEVFREVRRVLKDDGTLWLNLGDSYAGSGKGAWDRTDVQKEVYVPKPRGREASMPKVPPGLKSKDLVGIPWRVAFALQADGWYLRQDIIWHKPNPMPESVRDRCTKAHEYLFLLSKSPRYYFDHDEMLEEADRANHRASPGVRRTPPGSADHTGFRNGRHYETRNKRDVWSVPVQPFNEAHFATFPPDLIRPCVRAGCPAGGLVLDPFAGAGTTGLVALEEGRDFLGIELNPEYVGLIEKRLAPLLAVRTLDCFFEEGAEA